jgi:ABC-type nitrate/sulfonate/bicarbonate transport system substrate-binding protein
MSVLCFTIICGCNRSTDSKQATTATQPVAIAYSNTPAASPVHVLKHTQAVQSQFAFSAFSSGRQCLDALLSGGAQFATVSETNIAQLTQLDTDVVIIASICQSTQHVRCVTLGDSGIQKPADLLGRKVGVMSGTAGEYVLHRLLTESQILAKDVSVVNLKPAEMNAALLSHQIDAGVSWEPFIQALAKMKGNVISLNPDPPYRLSFLLVCRRAFASEHPQVVEQTLQDFANAIIALNQRSGSSLADVVAESGMDEGQLKAILPEYTFNLSLDSSLVHDLDDEIHWVSESSGKVPTRSAQQCIFSDPLRKFAPQSVQLASR